MAQKTLRLSSDARRVMPLPDTAAAVGLTSDADVVTLRFMSEVKWGGWPTRQVRLDRNLAEQLSRLLNDELEDQAWT